MIVNDTKYHTNALRHKQALKIRRRINPVLLERISSQKEALYLYKVKFRSTSPRLDYLLEGGLISLPDRSYLKRQFADEISANSILNSRKAETDVILFFYFYFLF